MVLLAIRSKSVYKYICYKIYKIIDEVTLMSKLAKKREESEKKKGTGKSFGRFCEMRFFTLKK